MAKVKKPLMLNETGKDIAASLQALVVQRARRESGESYEITPKMLQAALRMGIIDQYVQTGDQIVVQKESGIAMTCSTGQATIDDQKFIERIGHVQGTVYEFRYDGVAWLLEDGTETGTPVSLSDYGITYTGKPDKDATITAVETVQDLVLDVLQPDGYDHPSNPALTHALSLATHDCATYNTIAFDEPQALIYVDPKVYPDGLKAGELYTVTLDHGSNAATTTEDGTYGFTPTKDVPAGGRVRHTTMGGWMDSNDKYVPSHITGGKFVTYGPDDIQIESLNTVQVTDGSGTDLGTTTAENKALKLSAILNFTKRNAYGSNRYATSHARQWMQSKAAGAKSGDIASWYKRLDKFDMPIRSTIPGFLHGIDPEFLSVLGKVRKRTAVHNADTDGTVTGYVDTDELVCPLSMAEVGLGVNDGIVETSPDAEGNVVNKAYQYYIDHNQNSDRIKYYTGSARWWFLRGASPWNVCHVRGVSTDGSLSGGNARNHYGEVPSLRIV